MTYQPNLHEFFSLKWNPFETSIPDQALWSSEEINQFSERVRNLSKVGGFALVTGTPGMGKSAALRIIRHNLTQSNKIQVNELSRPQSRVRDFYNEIGVLYGVTMTGANRFGTFKRLQEDWQNQIQNHNQRPVLIIDEAQELKPEVLIELRILSSTDLDSRSILTVILAGDHRLSSFLNRQEQLPVRSRIRARLALSEWEPKKLEELIRHQIAQAGRPDLIDNEVMAALCDQALGSPRALNNLCSECLVEARKRGKSKIDMDILLGLSQSFILSNSEK